MWKVVYKNPWFSVFERKGVARGNRHLYHKIEVRQGTIAIPVLDNGSLVMERQYRHTLGRWLYELPAGHIEEGESASNAVVRELKEETGFAAKRTRFLFSEYMYPDLIRHREYFYLVTGLTKGKRHLEDSERIKVLQIPLKKAIRMITTRKITDAKTIAGVLYYAHMVETTGKKR